MTSLETTLYRKVKIGSRHYVIGLHPNEPEPLISIRQSGRRQPYVLPVSRLRIEGALAYGRAEQSAKRAARKEGIPWKIARKKFLGTLLPPNIRHKRTQPCHSTR